MKQFSYEEYRHILNWIKKNYNIMDYTDVTDDTESFAIIRHDVEFSPYRALKMAEIDNELGIKSSFFFQIRNNCYNSLSGDNIDIINKISNLGHYIGAHINTSNLSSNESLKSFVKKDMFILSEFIDTNVDRFSFHRPKSYQLKEYVKINGYVNAYDEQFFHYFENKKIILEMLFFDVLFFVCGKSIIRRDNFKLILPVSYLKSKLLLSNVLLGRLPLMVATVSSKFRSIGSL